jgi:hypothetical protein
LFTGRDRIEIGGSGYSISKRLPDEVEACFPDYGVYGHTLYALGFLTRGCNKRCAFCIVPAKEGRLKLQTASFDDFVPAGQRNVIALVFVWSIASPCRLAATAYRLYEIYTAAQVSPQ